jgi:predicted ATP-grasp superfamily ATP-dependent carboligase
MTRVFVYEYTCAAPPASLEAGGAASLRTEGEAMLGAVLADFASAPGVDVFTIRECVDEEAAFRSAARTAHWSLVIAPEFDQILETRCRWVLEEGGRLLGPSPEAARLCADKLQLARHWGERQVQTPPTVLLREYDRSTAGDRVVMKPRFGAGSQDMHLVVVNDSVGSAVGSLATEGPPLCESGGPSVASDLRPTLPEIDSGMIVQPYIPGAPASVAFLIGIDGHVPLLPTEQRLSDDGYFQYLGGRIPLPNDFAERAVRIASSAVAVVPGLFGYIGVDVVLGDDGIDWAIEINPRLTTSYVGLRALAETNLAGVMLRIAHCDATLPRWRDGSVEFTSNGKVTLRNA